MPAVIKISEPTLAALKIFAKQSSPITIPDLRKLLPPELQGFAQGVLAGLARNKRIKTAGAKEGYPAYVITAAGRAVLKLPEDRLKVSPGNPGQGAKLKRKAAPATIAPAPVLNISASADAVMDHISAVVRENHEYRQLLQGIAEKIAIALGLTLSAPIQPPEE